MRICSDLPKRVNIQALLSVYPTTHKAVAPFTANEKYIAYLPLAHVLELLAENLMLVFGVPIGKWKKNSTGFLKTH